MLNVEKKDNIKIASLPEINRLNITIADDVKHELVDLFSNKTKVIFNLENIEFVDSSGFGALISALKACKKTNSRFIIININNEVMELVKLMQLQNIFEIEDDMEKALYKLT